MQRTFRFRNDVRCRVARYFGFGSLKRRLQIIAILRLKLPTNAPLMKDGDALTLVIPIVSKYQCLVFKLRNDQRQGKGDFGSDCLGRDYRKMYKRRQDLTSVSQK